MTWELFEQKLDSVGYASKDKELIRGAFQFAENAHKGQTRASGDPYFTHVFEVASNVVEIHLDAHAVAASFLHDTVEDCNVSHETILQKFGEEIAFLVEGVTKLDKVQYSGVQRKVESVRRMFLAVAQDVRVVLIKLMDRLHNMQTISYLPEEKQRRIAKETLELYAPLAYRLGIGELKGVLQDLAFPILYPDEAAWIKKELEERVPEGKKYLEEIKPLVEETLREENVIPLAIDFRAKHHYSLWQKLLHYDMDFARITDLLAMRIVVNSLEDCYKALGIIHKLWKPLPGRIKDYIALPKPNGYRSLHTTVFCEGNRVTEFQIRTRQMHEEAEKGIAAHWAYEESGKPKRGKLTEKHFAWVQELPEWQKEVGNESTDEELLESLKIDFFKDRIFVLTPKGEVIDLPDGATPVDFAYHIHTEIGDHMIGAKVNGKMVQFPHKLMSGDSVEILTQKNRKPVADWLTFVKTSIAKNRIRAALRHEAELHSAEQRKHTPEHYDLHITSKDRVGLLKDISAVFSEFRINIQNISMMTQNKSFPVVVVSFQTRDEKQKNRLLIKLKAIPGIEEIAIQ